VVPAQEQVVGVQPTDSLDSQDLSHWSDLFDSFDKCFDLLSMVLPLAARKDPDKTKLAAAL
jgi:hypothetical protein